MNKKTKIYIVVLIWVAALIQLFVNSSINREEKLVEQAISTGAQSLTESKVKAYAFYSYEEMSATAKEKMAKNLAMELGIMSGYEISHREKDESETTTLYKEGEQGDTTIKIFSVVGEDSYGQKLVENYLMLEIMLKNNASGYAYQYKAKLEEMYESLGINANTNIYVCNQVKGELTESEKLQRIDEFMDEMGAKEVVRETFDGVICVYGYSRNIDEFVYQNSERVNVNIAFTYDEAGDVTYIHRAIPFVDRSL